MPAGDALAIEEQKVSGAIRTDFILSAEIMALTLAGIATSSVATRQLSWQVSASSSPSQSTGRGTHRESGRYRSPSRAARRKARTSDRTCSCDGSSGLLKLLALIGTAAMLWVGGSLWCTVWPNLASISRSMSSNMPCMRRKGAACLLARWRLVSWNAVQAVFGVLLGGLTIAAVKSARLALGQ